MCEQVFIEGVNAESSNIISNNFVDHKSEENETLDATAKKDNKGSTESYNKFEGGMKLLEMYIIIKLKLQILQFIFALNIFSSIFFIQMQKQPGGSTKSIYLQVRRYCSSN